MHIEKLRLPGALLLWPERHVDSRGYFCETYNAERYRSAGIDSQFVQDNHSLSASAGTLRGLHFQCPPKPQSKLVRCTQGEVVDVIVDLRRSSSTFKHHLKVNLSSEGGEQLFVPAGFAHGFLTLEDHTEVQYKTSNPYHRDLDSGIAFDDPDLAIDWGIDPRQMILSDKDRGLPKLVDSPTPFE